MLCDLSAIDEDGLLSNPLICGTIVCWLRFIQVSMSYPMFSNVMQWHRSLSQGNQWKFFKSAFKYKIFSLLREYVLVLGKTFELLADIYFLSEVSLFLPLKIYFRWLLFLGIGIILVHINNINCCSFLNLENNILSYYDCICFLNWFRIDPDYCRKMQVKQLLM